MNLSQTTRFENIPPLKWERKGRDEAKLDERPDSIGQTCAVSEKRELHAS